MSNKHCIDLPTNHDDDMIEAGLAKAEDAEEEEEEVCSPTRAAAAGVVANNPIMPPSTKEGYPSNTTGAAAKTTTPSATAAADDANNKAGTSVLQVAVGSPIKKETTESPQQQNTGMEEGLQNMEEGSQQEARRIPGAVLQVGGVVGNNSIESEVNELPVLVRRRPVPPGPGALSMQPGVTGGSRLVAGQLSHHPQEELEEEGLISVVEEQPGGVSSSAPEDALIEATLVVEDTEQQLQDQHQEEHNNEIFEATPLECMHITKKGCLRITVGILVVFLLIVGVGITTGVLLTSSQDDSSSKEKKSNNDTNNTTNDTDTTTATAREEDAPRVPILEQIKERGFLRCSIPVDGVGNSVSAIKDKEFWGESLLCKAVSAAIFGGTNDEYNHQVEFIQNGQADRPKALASGTVDLVSNGYTRTMDREVYLDLEDGTGGGIGGFHFSHPYFFIFHRMFGDKEYVRCAEDNFNTVGDTCSGLQVCVLNGTWSFTKLSLVLPPQHIVPLLDYASMQEAYLDDSCNVAIAVAAFGLDKTDPAKASNFVVSNQTFRSLESFGLVTAPHDPVWSDFVNWILQALFAAERYGITKENVHDRGLDEQFVHFLGFGDEYQDMFYNAIAAIGNMGDVFATYDENIIPRNNMNRPVSGNETGSMYSLPLGALGVVGPDPDPDDLLSKIVDRGSLLCGIQIMNEHPGFANSTTLEEEESSTNNPIFTYNGIDVDYCRIVAAGIFGDGNLVEFVELGSKEEGFALLRDGSIDVFAGIGLSLERDVKEPSTGIGFAFTKPYFYNNTSVDSLTGNGDSNRCLATSQHDNKWAKFVFWMVEATFLAEESFITQQSSNDMPAIELYGKAFSRMFRDGIRAAGNYGEIYERNLEPYIPREGRNRLVWTKSGNGPLFNYFPGLFN